jgi:tRNA dimethylallyltransferase
LAKAKQLNKISAILIAGPTASGKSALALELARQFDGVLINADSMQVYRDLRILTARPSLTDEEMSPHRLFGTVDGALNFSVGRWLAAATQVLDETNIKGSLPIFVGGTGLYFKALTQGLSAIPEVPDDLRQNIRAKALGRPVAELHAELMQCDPAMALRLRPTDPQRILRALEVYAATGQSLSHFQTNRAPPLLDLQQCLAVFLAPERNALNLAIDARFEAMLKAGVLNEVETLGARHLDAALPVMRAHGVPHLLRALKTEISLTDAAELAKRDTRHYAKRQLTFARHQLQDFQWVLPEQAEALILSRFRALSREPVSTCATKML